MEKRDLISMEKQEAEQRRGFKTPLRCQSSRLKFVRVKKTETFYDQSALERTTISIFPSRFCGTFWMRRVAVTTEVQAARHDVPC